VTEISSVPNGEGPALIYHDLNWESASSHHGTTTSPDICVDTEAEYELHRSLPETVFQPAGCGWSMSLRTRRGVRTVRHPRKITRHSSPNVLLNLGGSSVIKRLRPWWRLTSTPARMWSDCPSGRHILKTRARYHPGDCSPDSSADLGWIISERFIDMDERKNLNKVAALEEELKSTGPSKVLQFNECRAGRDHPNGQAVAGAHFEYARRYLRRHGIVKRPPRPRPATSQSDAHDGRPTWSVRWPASGASGVVNS